MKKIILALLIALFAFAAPVAADSPAFSCNAPKPTVAQAQLRLQTDQTLYALASNRGYDPILVGAGSIVFDYCWGLRNRYRVNDPRWEREYWARINGFAQAIAVESPFQDQPEGELTFGYRLRMEALGPLFDLIAW